MIAPADLAACREAIRTGSLSFHAASKLLPGRVRDPALALYAFCRVADDAVDDGADPAAAVAALRARLDLAYAGRPRNAPADRAMAALIAGVAMPRELPEALIEGLEWDADGRRYASLPELRAYAARVAAAVGAMMCVLMERREPGVLARACDLGVAMQLTNIARDVGEDARAGRVYLPLDWLDAAGIDPAALTARPEPGPALAAVTDRLLAEADELYRRAEPGIGCLPLACRPGIYAARHIYAGIGGAVRRNGCDAISRRGRTGRAEKAGWLALSAARAAASTLTPGSALSFARPLPETAFLVQAASLRAAAGTWGEGRAGAVVGAFAQLAARDRLRRQGLPG